MCAHKLQRTRLLRQQNTAKGDGEGIEDAVGPGTLGTLPKATESNFRLPPWSQQRQRTVTSLRCSEETERRPASPDPSGHEPRDPGDTGRGPRREIWEVKCEFPREREGKRMQLDGGENCADVHGITVQMCFCVINAEWSKTNKCTEAQKKMCQKQTRFVLCVM